MTLVNVVTVAPEHQQELVDVLVEPTAVMRQLTGFVSANLHPSRDVRRVVNYAQWRSVEELPGHAAGPPSDSTHAARR